MRSFNRAPAQWLPFPHGWHRGASADAPAPPVDAGGAADEDPPGLTGHFDGELIEQAMLNLVKNAVEAMTIEKGPGIRPQIRILCTSDGEMLHLDVVDNGPGLPPNREEVFLPFYTTKKTGSGIGLTIARRIAHAHGGLLLAKPSANGAYMSLQLPQRPGQFVPSATALA